MQILPAASGSGLLIAEEGADEKSVGALLRRHDSALRLLRRFDEDRRVFRWEVWEYHGPDRPSQHVISWCDREGVPLPLSSQLLEAVKQHDRTTVGAALDPDAVNAALRASRARESLEEKRRIAEDHAPYIDRGRVVVAPHGRKNKEAFDR